jgi:hypothetical protein
MMTAWARTVRPSRSLIPRTRRQFSVLSSRFSEDSLNVKKDLVVIADPMHLVIGFINVIVGHFLTSLYLASRRDWIGRLAVRRCCKAFRAGAGLDDAAVSELIRMGPDGARLLQSEADRSGEQSDANRILTILGGPGQS